MKKLNKRQIEEVTRKLGLFWEKRRKFYLDLMKKEEKLQKEMNKKLNLNVEIEFFYVDGECVGIGALDFSKRKIFPLIHDRDLE